MHIYHTEGEKTPGRWRIMNKKTNATALENFIREATTNVNRKKSTLSHIPKESMLFRTIATNPEIRQQLAQLGESAAGLAQLTEDLLDYTEETED